MQESETRFDNMSMSKFRILIMFRSVGRSSEMGYTVARKDRRARNSPPISM